jgi:ATP-dependent protease ClpP protease subunit
MKEVLIDDAIGYDWWTDSGITAKGVAKQLEGIADGEDIKITVNSPGGSVYEGIVIFNLIRDFAKTHPVAVRINCMAMSMASYIALAARSVDKNAVITVSDNSIVMIHNPWTYTWGDYRELKKEADYLEKLAALYGSVHAAVSGKSEKDIRAAMDYETYYVGKEIQDAGFANDFDVISETETDTDPDSEIAASTKNNLIINAKFAFDKTKEKSREAKTKDASAYHGDLEKAVALYSAPKPPAAKNASDGEKILLGGYMKLTPEELLAQNKELYDAVFALGEKAGYEKEKTRVSAHLILGKKAGSLALAAKHIEAGVSTNDEVVQAEYLAARMDAGHIENRNADNVGDVHTGGEAGGANDDAKLEAAFSNGFAGKDTGGKSWAE